MTATIPRSAEILTRRTRRLYLSWWMTHYAVGMGGVIAGTLLTALTSAGKGSDAVAPGADPQGRALLVRLPHPRPGLPRI